MLASMSSSGGGGSQGTLPGTPQTTSREGSVSLQYPMLNKSNYSAWSIKMEVYMEAQGVWEAVESEEPVETRKDKMALAAIYQGISEETLLQLGAKKTAKEAWKALKTMHLGAGRVKEVRAQALRWELEGLRMRDHETIDDFTGKIIVNVNHLRSLGEEVSEAYVVKKILRAVSPKFLQIASTIEEFGDLENKTIEEVAGSLKAHEERMRGHEDRREEHVYLARTDWKPRSRSNHGENYGPRDHGYDRRRGRWGRDSPMRGQGITFGDTERRQTYDRSKQRFDISKIQCYACDEYGHFAYECKEKGKRHEEANLIEHKDDEPSLFMMEELELSSSEEILLKKAEEIGEHNNDVAAETIEQESRTREEHESLTITNEERLEFMKLQSELKQQIDRVKQEEEFLLKEREELKQYKRRFEKEWEALDEKKVIIEKAAKMNTLEKKLAYTRSKIYLKEEIEESATKEEEEPPKLNKEKEELIRKEEEKRKQKKSAKMKEQHRLEEIAKEKEFKREIEVEFVKSKEQLTDLMAQALPRCKMKELSKLE